MDNTITTITSSLPLEVKCVILKDALLKRFTFTTDSIDKFGTGDRCAVLTVFFMLDQFISLIGLDPIMDDVLALTIQESTFDARLFWRYGVFDKLARFILSRSIKMKKLLIGKNILDVMRPLVFQIIADGSQEIKVTIQNLPQPFFTFTLLKEHEFYLQYITSLDLSDACWCKEYVYDAFFLELPRLTELIINVNNVSNIASLRKIVEDIRQNLLAPDEVSGFTLAIKVFFSYAFVEDETEKYVDQLNEFFFDNRDLNLKISISQDPRDCSSIVINRFCANVIHVSSNDQYFAIIISPDQEGFSSMSDELRNVPFVRHLTVTFGPSVTGNIKLSNPMIGKLRVNDLTPQTSISIREMYSLKSLTLSNCIISYNMINNLPENLREINFIPSSKLDDSISANTTIKLPIHLKTMNLNFNEIKSLPKISNGDELKEFKEFQFAFFGGACYEYTNVHELRRNPADGSVSNNEFVCFSNVISEPLFTLANFQSFLNSLPSELQTLSLIIYNKMCRNFNLKPKYYEYSLHDRKELTFDNFQSLENLNFHCSTMSTNLKVSIFEPPVRHLNLTCPAMLSGSFPSTLTSLNINMINYVDTFTQFWLKFIIPLHKLTTFKCKFKGEETVDFRKLKIPSNLTSIELCFNSVCIILDQIPKNLLYFSVFDSCYDEDFGSLGSENLFEDFIISSIVVDSCKGETVESIQKQIYWFPLEGFVWKNLRKTDHPLKVLENST
ncbi:unnamed protein product [Ambrosiozyma monospora]|uniref:Unnamed protein product n=1 Tax=Ambrosiozyma monospora TaxID=43982 RepID=A0A9W6YWS6_AMBMO|nr:unnamed protein product [Ambrosiozyma monospora]